MTLERKVLSVSVHKLLGYWDVIVTALEEEEHSNILLDEELGADI